MKIQLTISLLVSDRMETLGRCLSSLKPLLRELDSELIIVYTGKRPETLELAKEYTAHIIPFVWCKDFAKARNAGLKEAKGEWFLYLDDDEWFEDTEEIIQFFKSGEYKKYQSATYVQRNYFDWEGRTYADAYVGRMCRLAGETRFVYPIHENLKPFGEPCKEFSAYVHHYGYAGTREDKEQKLKTERNLPLLLNRLKAEEASAHLYAQLAQEYASIRKYGEAIRYCREGLRLAQKEDRRDSLEMWLQLELPHLITCTGDLKRALEEGEAILGSPRLAEVGELNLTADLIALCWNLREYKKGLELVNRYRKGLEYLWKRPEKAMAQNGITATFSSAEKQEAEIYVKGLFFASETENYETVKQILCWMPWGDTVQMPSRYGDLEEWKSRYQERRKDILNCYYELDSDSAYVALQKAYYEEERGRAAKVSGFWEQCTANPPEGVLDQLIDMAVRNGFALQHLLEKMTLDEWKSCAKALAESVEIPKMEAFYQKISSELLEYPVLAEELKQSFLEKQLLQGFLESGRLIELMGEYCRSVKKTAEILYKEEILRSPDSYLLPVRYKFAVRIEAVLRFIENGSYADSISLLAEALRIYPQMSIAVKHLTDYLNERLEDLERPVSEEFAVLGGQVKRVLYGLVEGKRWGDAYGVAIQLAALLPNDMEVLKLKQEILRNLN